MFVKDQRALLYWCNRHLYFYKPLASISLVTFCIAWQYYLALVISILDSNNLKHIQAKTKQDKYPRCLHRHIFQD